METKDPKVLVDSLENDTNNQEIKKQATDELLDNVDAKSSDLINEINVEETETLEEMADNAVNNESAIGDGDHVNVKTEICDDQANDLDKMNGINDQKDILGDDKPSDCVPEDELVSSQEASPENPKDMGENISDLGSSLEQHPDWTCLASS